MHPILGQVVGVTIYTYSVLMALGILGGLWIAYVLGRRSEYTSDELLDVAMWALAAGMIGARLYHVLVNWEYYSARPLSTLTIWDGGLAFPGGFVAGLAAIALYARWKRLDPWGLFDAVAVGTAFGQAMGWLGAFFHGLAYGMPGEGPLAFETPDIYGIVAPRFPTQIAASVLYLIVFVLLFTMNLRPLRPGFLFGTYLLLASAGQFVLEFTRGDETIYLGIFRIAQLLYAVEFAAAVGLLVYLMRHPRLAAAKDE
jgi:phosphatidylglycerol:prolipoprotein diacylglycerol transferase